MKKPLRTIATTNSIGAVGYMLLATTWVFFVANIVGLVVDTPNTHTNVTVSNASSSTLAEPSATVMAASYVITAVVAAVTIAIIIVLPYWVGKRGSRLVHRLMVMLSIDMTQIQLFLAKGLLVTLPLIGLIVINMVFAPETIAFSATYAATVVVATAAIGLFFGQLLLARWFKIPVDQTW